jgi:hypothetical protein
VQTGALSAGLLGQATCLKQEVFTVNFGRVGFCILEDPFLPVGPVSELCLSPGLCTCMPGCFGLYGWRVAGGTCTDDL